MTLTPPLGLLRSRCFPVYRGPVRAPTANGLQKTTDSYISTVIRVTRTDSQDERCFDPTAGRSEYRIATLRGLGCPVIFEMGYPPMCLPIVAALHRAGLTAWWFDGDRAAARCRFIRRNTVSLEALDIQMARIAEAWPLLAEFYGPRILHVLAADGSFTAPEIVFGEMFE